jgi:hypothetical protein
VNVETNKRGDYVMTKEELEARLNAAEKEITDLKAKLNEASEIPEFLEFNIGAVVWYMDSDLKVYNYKNCVSEARNNYNNFHTFEYAKEFADICREIAMLLHCKWHIDRDYVPDWKDATEPKYFLYFDSKKDKYDITYVFFTHVKYPMVFFSNKDVAKKAADWMNKRHKQERSD